MAKLDIAHAYRNIPVHPDDRHLLGMMWNTQLFIDTVLPFRLRSAPKIFSAVADALEWILIQQGVSHSIHYLDNFFTVGSPTSNDCSNNLHRITETCKLLGVPLATGKIVSPTCQLTFLSIEIDSESLDSVGPSCTCMQGGPTWKNIPQAHHQSVMHSKRPGPLGLPKCRVPVGVQWWHLFLEKWNGISCLHTHIRSKEDVIVATDASGSWGCGAVWSQNWFHCLWNEAWAGVPINTKELVPIVLAVAMWGSLWRNSHVLILCNNLAVVMVLQARTCKDTVMMHLLRSLHYFLAKWDTALTSQHIPGTTNHAADAISHNNMQAFHSMMQDAPPPTVVPLMLWDLLVMERPDCHGPRLVGGQSCAAYQPRHFSIHCESV